jgi:hypothetical protein
VHLFRGAFVTLLLAVVFPVAASSAPRHDGVVGDATLNGCLGSPGPCYNQKPFTVSAHGDTLGAHGHYTFGSPGGSGLYIKGKVTCVNAIGNVASVGGIITKASNPSGDVGLVGHTFVVYFVDNGPPTASGLSPDLATPPDIDPTTAPCSSAVSPFGYVPVGSGDVTVTDGG